MPQPATAARRRLALAGASIKHVSSSTTQSATETKLPGTGVSALVSCRREALAHGSQTHRSVQSRDLTLASDEASSQISSSSLDICATEAEKVEAVAHAPPMSASAVAAPT
eukprot:1166555-Pleurochrysis_carterae.AAC.1